MFSRAACIRLFALPFPIDTERNRFYATLYLGSAALFVIFYFAYPRILEAGRTFRKDWKPLYTYAGLGVTCAGFFAFILYFGNRQFGGFDFSVMVDIGWRLASGQKPYRDFVCTPPPGFYLGAQYAFQLFGVRWDSLLLATSGFACVTFLWIYSLLEALLKDRPVAYLVALSIECATMLLTSYWWYNSITSIASCIFFLSCFLFLRDPDGYLSRLSYAGSLLLLCLMKPNVAGLMIGSCVLLVLVVTRRRGLFLGLTLAGAFGAIAVLALNGVSVAGLLASYRGAAVGRGIGLYGIENHERPGLVRAACYWFGLAAPLTLCWGWLTGALRRMELREVAAALLVLLSLMVSVFGIFTNGEIKDVEWPVLICSNAILLFSTLLHPVAMTARWRRVFIALICSLVAGDLYIGATRFRVQTIGIHEFFEWADNAYPVGVPFFGDLTGSRKFSRLVEQTGQALRENPQPVFFGPRMEFLYAVFRIPSPRHTFLWWHPGTSFAVADEPALLKGWQANGYSTLIFLKDDFIYYTPEFRRLIDQLYVRDDRFPELTLFHAKSLRTGVADLR